MLKLSNVFSVVRETERGSKGDIGEPGPKGESGDQGAPGPAIFVDSGEEVVTVKGQKVNDTCAVTFDWPTERDWKKGKWVAKAVSRFQTPLFLCLLGLLSSLEL